MAITYTAGKPESEGGGPSPLLEAGSEHEFEVVDAVQKRSKSGNDMIEVAARAVMEDGTLGRKLYEHLVFTEKAFWKVDLFLAATGLHPGEGNDVELDAQDLIGKRFRAVVGVEPDSKGKDQNVIDYYVLDGDEEIPF